MTKIKNFFRNQMNRFACFILGKLMNHMMKKQFGNMNFNNMDDEDDENIIDE